MAASNPTITATIKADDQASATIKRLVGVAKDASENSSRLSGIAARNASSAVKSMAAEHTAAFASMSQRMGEFASKLDGLAAGAFAGFGAHFLHETLAIGGEMSRIERRTAAFTDFTKKQMADIRTAADTTLSGGPGGPQGALDAARALGMSGVRGDEIAGILPYVAMHADETGESQEHSAEALVGITQMLGFVKDEFGRTVSIHEATVQQAVEGVRKTESALITANKIAPGSLANLVEAVKFAAPTSGGLNRDPSEMFALITALGERGIKGAEAGNTARSVEARLAAPTAKARAAIATSGLTLSDYVQLNPSLMDEAGIERGLSQRLGNAVQKIHAGLAAAIDKFKAGGTGEDFQASLTDLLVSSGSKSMQNRVVAANLARDTMGNFVQTVDLPKFLADAGAKGLGVGFLNQVFGKEMGSRMAVLLGDHVSELAAEYRTKLAEDQTAKAKDEKAESYDGRLAELTGALTGLKDRLFQPMGDPIGAGYHGLADMVREVSGAGEGLRTVMDGVLIGGTALAGLKTAGTLAELAGGLMKLATGAEAAGPLVGALATLADIPFTPVVAGIGAVVGAFEVLQHRAELWSAFEKWKNGDVEAPTTPEDADKLREKIETDRAAIDDRRATLDRNLPPDPRLENLQATLAGLIFERRGRIDEMPGVRAALGARQAAERERPQTDPDYIAARDRLYDVQALLKKREAIAGRNHYVQAIDRVTAAMQAEDPSAGDMILGGMRAQRQDLKSRLPAGVDTSAAVEALDREILARLNANQDTHERALQSERKFRDDALRAAGAPDVTPGDLDAAARAKDEAMARAQQRHDAELAKAQADVARARLDAEAAIRQDPEVKDAQARVDSRRDEVRATAARASGDDGKIRALEADIDRTQAALTAFEQTRPVFTRMGENGRPRALPDLSKTSVPRAGMPFGPDGPKVEAPAFTRPAIPELPPLRIAPPIVPPPVMPEVAPMRLPAGIVPPPLAPDLASLRTIPAAVPPAPPTAPPPTAPPPAAPSRAEPAIAAPRAAAILEAPRPLPIFLQPQYAPRGSAEGGLVGPQKVDVGVNGTVTGTAEVHNTTSITVEPSTYFTGLVRSVEHMAQLNLSGKMGETMTGSNGAKPSMPSPAGIGHL